MPTGSLVAMVTDLCHHLTYDSRRAIQCMTCSSRIISESPPEMLRMAEFDFLKSMIHFQIQSTLVISKLEGPAETLRDIRSSTYQIFRIEENTNRTTKFH